MQASLDIPRRLIVAVGGNAIDPAGSRGTPEEQKAIAEATAKTMLPLLELDNQLVIVHGNGPQVGKLLLANAAAQDRVAPQSLDILVAQTQGALAYILSQAFENALREAGNPRHVVGLVTQVEVDPKDPAFANPTKPVGPFFSEAEARKLANELGVTVQEDSGRGWRYVVPSPKPRHVCDISLVESLMCTRTVVIAGGGGGIPVVRDEEGRRHGVEAVIDKDLTTAVMANVLGIRDMMILTAVPRVAIHFGTPQQQELEQVSASDMRRYLAEGHFPAGSMGPKVEAALRFLDAGGRRVIVTSLDTAVPALKGETGTHIVPDHVMAQQAESDAAQPARNGLLRRVA
ncbi:carbamate kinase [Ramlibacter monticola]|uniref:Carbamate kinase n=1 Tax=Ramlibacter monticola TaxID=1926872 RepID=A0A936Z0F6_9BURK|nr:carbamate kinase [Ramlibacter monticola]MBL0391345.1 carbamate kinase [Ramlibacter monticola]